MRTRMAWNNRWTAALIGLIGLLALSLLPASAGAQPQPQVTRSIDSADVSPGQTISVAITPSGFTGFYAVREVLGDLELVTHTADNYEEGTFVMLEAQSFTYEMTVPETAQGGDQFPIAGEWWTDPEDKRTVTPAQTVLSVPEATPTPATSTPTPTATPLPPTPTPVPPTPTATVTPIPPTQTPTATATPVPPGKPAFRVGPQVRLRPLNDEITRDKDGLVELFFANPGLNDATMIVEVFVSVPSGIHVYGQGFGIGTAAGTVHGLFEAPPGTDRTVFLNVKSEKVGEFFIQLSGTYYPEGNKDLFNPVSLTHTFNVRAPSAEPLSPPVTAAEPTATAAPAPAPTPAPTPSGRGISCNFSRATAGANRWGGVGDMALMIGPVFALIAWRRTPWS